MSRLSASPTPGYNTHHSNVARGVRETYINRDFDTEGRVTTALGDVSILPLMTRIIGDHFGPDRFAKTVHQMTLLTPDLQAP